MTEDQEREESPAEGVLRSLASWLGAGGYNAPTVDARVFEEKIRWGVQQAVYDAIRDERRRCIRVCEERGAAYRKTRAPGWFEVDHETAQCAAGIRQLPDPDHAEDPIHELSREAVHQMHGQLDDELRRAINAHLGRDDWQLEQLRGHLVSVGEHLSAWTTYYYDGEALLQVGPVRIEHHDPRRPHFIIFTREIHRARTIERMP